MANDIIQMIKDGQIDFSDQKMKTAYALNLCTVSVSQIIDYDDAIILEQEYEAILNNINIEKMPKDEALLKILKQLLDTITFFRIEEGDKALIDKEYQHRMKNAIWNAIPNFGLLIAGGNPFTMVGALASQIGIGYMNYRRAKAENALSYEKAMWQLHRSAIEQFNGLRRELFDTAWRLADAYEFPDSYRLTERQVKQYDDILMDPDPYRRYERLNTIKDAFVAYPPFWYFWGSTANELINISTGDEADFYRSNAKTFYDIFIRAFTECNLLRENQIASSCALEYINLLDAEEDKDKIIELLEIATTMSGNANDVLQLCAFGYLKINKYQEAAEILRVLVNERYNPIVNGQLLSGLYVSSYIEGDESVVPLYGRLKTRVDKEYLYCLPDKSDTVDMQSISDSFIASQKEILSKKYGIAIDRFRHKYRVLFGRCIPVPGSKEYTDSYYDESVDAFSARRADGQLLKEKHGLEHYADSVVQYDYPYNYLTLFNKMFDDVCELNCTQGKEEELLQALSKGLIQKRNQIKEIRKKAEDRAKFTLETYYEMLSLGFDQFSGEFFALIIQYATEYLNTKKTIVSMNDAETNLRTFCLKQGFGSPDEMYDTADDLIIPDDDQPKMYLGLELIDEGESTIVIDQKREETLDVIRRSYSRIILDKELVDLVFEGSEAFDRYFITLEVPDKRNIRRKTVAILDDKTTLDNDLLFTTEGVIRIQKRKMKSVVPYDEILVNKTKQGEGLIIHSDFTNGHISMPFLIDLIEQLSSNHALEVKAQSSPLELIKKVMRKTTEV